MRFVIIIVISFIYSCFFAQGSFTDTITTDANSNHWDIGWSFSFTNGNNILMPIVTTNPTGNAIKLARIDEVGQLKNVVRIVDTSITRHSHLTGSETIIKINKNRYVIPLIRLLDTINFTTDSTKLYFVKIDSLGIILDSLLFNIPNGGQYNFRDSYLDTDSTFLILGTIKQFNDNHWDISLLRLDTNFNVLCDKRYGDVEDDAGVTINTFNNGGYLISSFHEYPGGLDRNTGLYRVDSSGNLIWTKYYGKSNYEMEGGFASVLTNNSFYLLSKDWRDGEPYCDMLLTRFNEQGDSLWSVRYQKAGESEYPFAAPIVLSDGNLLLPALFYDSLTTNYENGGTVGWILKVDTIGQIIWEQELNYFKDLNGPQFVSYNNYYDIQQSLDNGFVLSGHMSRIDLNGQDFFGLITKLDSNGCVVSECASFTGISSIAEEITSYSVYPNPAGSLINISGDLEMNDMGYSIYLLDGRIVQSGTLKRTIDISYLNSGTYLISIQSIKEITTLKFIKE